MAAKKKEIRKVAAAPDAAPDQRIVRVYAPEKSKHTEMIGGSAAEAARALVERLRDEARVLR
jgi:electron transfer flavoprotein alpha/beta subunit